MYQLSMMTCHCKLTKQNDNMIFFQYKHMRNIKYTVKNTTRYTLKITYHNFKYLNHNYTVPCTFGLVTTREQLTPNLLTKTHFFQFEFLLAVALRPDTVVLSSKPRGSSVIVLSKLLPFHKEICYSNLSVLYKP